jgi:hypothetical protein
MKVPVLVVFFNRPNSVLELVSSLSKVKPKKVYLACDGPRGTVPGEHLVVKNLRARVLSLIDWDCEVFTYFMDHNIGCKYNVSSAVSWFFQNEDKGIVLEDDCIPVRNFFEFAEKMLDFYENDFRVGAICGRNEVADTYRCCNSYFFSRKFFCWGWASWSSRVLDNDVELGHHEVPVGVFHNLSWKERLMLKGMIGLIKSKFVNSWAYPFDLSFRNKGQLCLIPGYNLVKNIGFDTIGAHSRVGAKDTLPVWEGIVIAPNDNVAVYPDNQFMSALIEKRFPSILKLVLFSMARYVAPIKKRLGI